MFPFTFETLYDCIDPEQTTLLPLIPPSLFGINTEVMLKFFELPFPQELLGVIVIFPFEVPTNTVTTLEFDPES